MPRLWLFVFVAVLIIVASTAAHAQWLNYPTPGTPRTKDGKPNLTAPAPRVNGKPDLVGRLARTAHAARGMEGYLGRR